MLKKSLGFIAKNEKAFTIGFLIAALLLPLVLKTKYAFRMATVSMMYILVASNKEEKDLYTQGTAENLFE